MTTAIASHHVEPGSNPKRLRWGGRVASGLAVLFLAFDGTFKLFAAPEVVRTTEALGWSSGLLFGLGALQLALLVLYVVPRTAVLGALLWLGLWLRDARLRALLPFTSTK